MRVANGQGVLAGSARRFASALLRACLVLSCVLGLGAAPARAEDAGGGSLVGLGFGPSATFSGELGRRFTAAHATGRIRAGGRVGHLGFEIVGSFAGAEGEGLSAPSLALATPTLVYYPQGRSRLQLALRLGLGYGAIGGQRLGPPPPCDVEPPCPGPTSTSVQHPVFGLDTGAVVQVHLGRRTGGRMILFADLGLALLRAKLDDGVVTGTATLVTFGFAHGMEF